MKTYPYSHVCFAILLVFICSSCKKEYSCEGCHKANLEDKTWDGKPASVKVRIP